MECVICGKNEMVAGDAYYLKCPVCGCQQRKTAPGIFIINDLLTKEEVTSRSLLDKFKTKVLNQCKRANDMLVDIGSASGKFLFQNKDLFKDYCGVEVTKECLDFCKNTLELRVADNLTDIGKNNLSVVTFWHSLEHIPFLEISHILAFISQNAVPETRIIISVPNTRSLMYRLFGKDYAFYDPSSHFHQFSKKSLDLLLGKTGFIEEKSFASLAYSSFGYLQSFLNKFNSIHNFLYYFKKRGETYGKSKMQLWWLYMYNLILAAIFSLPSLVLTGFDFIFKDQGGVLTICYRLKQ